MWLQIVEFPIGVDIADSLVISLKKHRNFIAGNNAEMFWLFY